MKRKKISSKDIECPKEEKVSSSSSKSFLKTFWRVVKVILVVVLVILVPVLVWFCHKEYLFHHFKNDPKLVNYSTSIPVFELDSAHSYHAYSIPLGGLILFDTGGQCEFNTTNVPMFEKLQTLNPDADIKPSFFPIYGSDCHTKTYNQMSSFNFPISDLLDTIEYPKHWKITVGQNDYYDVTTEEIKIKRSEKPLEWISGLRVAKTDSSSLRRRGHIVLGVDFLKSFIVDYHGLRSILLLRKSVPDSYIHLADLPSKGEDTDNLPFFPTGLNERLGRRYHLKMRVNDSERLYFVDTGMVLGNGISISKPLKDTIKIGNCPIIQKSPDFVIAEEPVTIGDRTIKARVAYLDGKLTPYAVNVFVLFNGVGNIALDMKNRKLYMDTCAIFSSSFYPYKYDL
jgi:hypothetical protein